MRALIVDDSLEIREIIAAYLTAAGYPDPAKAANAEAALGLLGISSSGITPAPAATIEGIDVILMDIMMPGMDGIEACARIKRHQATSETPVLMVSSRDDNTALQQAFLAGASDYVRKPIERVELLARIRSALRLKAELDRRRAQELALRNELDRLRASLSAAAADPLTGLPSPLVAGGIADAALAAGRTVGILAIAVDGLSAGSQPLDSAERLSRQVLAEVERSPGGLGDLLAAGSSIGSFFTILLDRPAVDATAQAERLRLAVERARLAHGATYPDGRSNGIATISIGIAHSPPESANAAILVEQAKRALAIATARGGNRIEHALGTTNGAEMLGRASGSA